MTDAAKLFKNIATSWFGLLINIVISFLLAPYVVQKLGNTWYGIWAIVGQFTGYLYLLDFGVRESVIRYTAKYYPRTQTAKLNRVITTSLIIYAPILVLCLLISWFASWRFPHWFDINPELASTTQLVVLLVGFTIAQTFVFNVFTGILQGLHRFDVTNLFGILFSFVRAALIVAALHQGYGIVALSVISLLLALVSGSFTVYMARSLLKRAGMNLVLVSLKWRQFFSLARRVGGYSIFVLISNIGQKVTLVSDAIIVGIFMPVASVTFYAIAGSLIGYLRGLVTATAQVFNPLTSHYAALHDNAQVQQVLIRGSRLTIMISLPIIAAYSILGREFIGLWMGSQYSQQSGDVLAILAVVYVFSSPHHVISSVLYGLSRHQTLSYLRIAEAVVNLALSIVLVQHMGLIGVALGTAIPHLLMTALVLPVLVTRTIHLSLAKYYAEAYSGPLLAIVPFAAGAMYFRSQAPPESLIGFFLQIALLLSVYLLVSYRVALDAADRQFVRQKLMLLTEQIKGIRTRD